MSSLVTFQLVVVPVLRKLMGIADPMLRRVRVYTSEPLPLDPARYPEFPSTSCPLHLPSLAVVCLRALCVRVDTTRL